MAQVLTIASNVICPHTGKVTLTSSAKLKVNGTPVLLESGLGQIAGCTQSSQSTTPDLKVDSLTSGKAQKLKAGGNPVLLSTLSGLGSGKPPGAISSSESQTRLAAS